MFDILQIAQQHKDLFPLADKKGQIKKLSEELTEYMLASTMEQKKKELADCLIVCAGIYRFDTILGSEQMLEIYKIIKQNKFEEQDIEQKANTKWQINLNRKWEYKDGRDHHLGIDGEE